MNTQKIAVVTGGNRGIGYETARQLARQGVEVLLGARDIRAADSAAAKLRAEGLDTVSALQLDVTDAASVAAAAQTIERRCGRLDILINNAGIMRDHGGKLPSEQPMDVWYETFETNLFGVISVTRALLPLLKKSPAGRIVNLSSVLGSLTLHSDPKSRYYNFKLPAYDVSKTALNAWTVHLAWELRDTAIKVNAAHPGYVKTDMNKGAGDLDLDDGARTSVELALLDSDGPSGGYVHRGETLPW